MTQSDPTRSGRVARARAFLAGLLILAALLAAAPLSAQRVSRKPFGDWLSRVHQERQRSYDLQHVLLRLTLDERRKQVSGTATLTLRPLNGGFQTVELDSAELTIRSVTTAGGEQLAFETSGNKLLIRLPAPAGPGDSIAVIVRFEGQPRKGLYFVGPDQAYPDKPVQIWSQGEVEDSHYWFPVYDYPNDKATSEGFYTVHSDYMVISNGALLGVETRPEANTRTYHWKQDVPHSTYLISVVMGKFEKYTEQAGGLPLEYYVPPGTGREKAFRSFHATPDALRFFSSKIGIQYPYPKYAQVAVHDFVFGGMENISATTLTDRTLHEESSEPQVSSVDLVTHELAHQWFGDLLTCANWAHVWLNEGFATYWADLYREHRFGEQEFRYSLYQEATRYLEEDRQRYRRPLVTSYYTDPLDLFDRTTYEKGALVLDMLRFVLGDDRFFAAMTHYAQKHQAGTVVTDDLRKAVEESAGENLGWFFEQWTTKAGYPELEVTQQWYEAGRTLHLSIEQKQVLDEQTPLFRMPVEVEFTTPAGRTRRRIEFSSARDEFDFVLDAKPSMIRFDPDHRILATVKFPKTVPELVYQLENDTAVPGRIWAARQLLQEGGSPEVVGALRQALAGESFWGVKEAVAAVLGDLKSDAARDALAAALNDADARVRQAAVRALGSFRHDSQAARLVASAYKKDRSTLVVAEAALAAGKIQSPNAKKLLAGAVKRNSDQDVIRRYALRGLGELGDQNEWATVARWLAYGRHPETRMAAVDALLRLGNEQDGKTARELIALVRDPDFYVKQRAIYALGEGHYQQARAVLLQSAETEVDSRVRRSARMALERLASSANFSLQPSARWIHPDTPAIPALAPSPAAAFANP